LLDFSPIILRKKAENNVRKFTPKMGFDLEVEENFRRSSSYLLTNIVIKGTREVTSEKLISRIKMNYIEALFSILFMSREGEFYSK